MSRLWTKRFSTVPAVQAGIFIGRNQVCAVVLGPEASHPQAHSIHVQDLARPLFAGQPEAGAEAALAEALRVVSGGFRGKFASVRVALPDTVIRGSVFELDELPRTEELRRALLRWRFAREWQRPEESLDCRGFNLGEDRGKQVFFGQAGDRYWLDCVRRALTQVGIVPWSLNAAAVYRFSCFHDAIAGRSGALLSLDPDCWNLQLWDAAGRVRRVLTRLRETGAAGKEGISIADEVERAVLAYVEGDGARTVDKLFIAGNESDMALLAQAFGGRLREEAELLRTDEKISGGIPGLREGSAPLALAAALNI